MRAPNVRFLETGFQSLLPSLWRLATSRRMALVLMLAIGLLALVGAMVPQLPKAMASSPALADQWLTGAKGEYGAWGEPFWRLGFFSLFSAPWFRGLLVLLGLNLTACTAQRGINVWQATSISERRWNLPPGGVTRDLTLDSKEDAAEAWERRLHQRGLQVTKREDDDKVELAAERRAWSSWLSLGSHGGLLVILAGALLTAWGQYETTSLVTEGGTAPIYPLGHPDHTQIRLEDFRTSFYPGGQPKDYISQVVLFKGGQKLKQGPVRAGAPLSANGLRLYQSSCGPAAALEVHREGGGVLLSETVPFVEGYDWQPAFCSDTIPPSNRWGTPAALMPLPTTDLNLMLALYGGKTTQLRIIGVGEATGIQPQFDLTLGPGETANRAGFVFRFLGLRHFSVLQVKQDPGANWIWTGAVLFLVGLVSSFWLPPQRCWVQIAADGVRLRGDAALVNQFTLEMNSGKEMSPPSPPLSRPS